MKLIPNMCDEFTDNPAVDPMFIFDYRGLPYGVNKDYPNKLSDYYADSWEKFLSSRRSPYVLRV